jgi:serine/threonine protein kinase/Tol biopolymer transport system component
MSDREANIPPGSRLDRTDADLTPERWQKIKELTLEAEAMDARERDVFLRRACDLDEELRREVDSLLVAENHDGSSSFSTEGLLQSAGLTPSAIDPVVGRRVGAYEVVRAIGQGGMANVYLAVRADDAYRKQVAVKIVRSGLRSADVLTRFRSERQTLACLDHSNIVRLIDGGSAPDGVPYLVMDYVQGIPVDEYCDSHKLSVEARLRLFRAVCDGVHYAHLHLVVHRDLKPSNILVTTDGIPKLLDFGIAKVLDPDLSEPAQRITQTVQRRMTPAYASPEQVRGKPVTQASDIYSLGVVLYELLTGHRPYRLKSPTPVELEQAICEQEPENPSTAVDRVETETSSGGTTVTKTPELVSQTREGEPEKLRRRLRGDLDNIVLKALRKEPQRRYASVEELSRDIQRHLDHRPVIARRSTIAYRASKFVQRRKTEVAAAASFLFLTPMALMLAALLGFLPWALPEPKIRLFVQITDDGRQKVGADLMPTIPSPYASDGQNVYFPEEINGSMALARVSEAGGEPFVIPTPFKGIIHLDFSPVRSEFLLMTGKGTEMDLPVWSMPFAAGPARRLGGFSATSFAWSPDGQLLFYTTNHDLFVCKSDGTGSRKIVTVPGLPVLPRLSPKGDVIRFTLYEPRNITSTLWEVGLDGVNLRPLFPEWADVGTCCGNWVAGGDYFAFRVRKDRRNDIWIRRERARMFRKPNSAPVQLTAGPLDFYNVAVSKDGRKLFVMGRQRRAELLRFDSSRSELVPYLKGISAEVSILGDQLAFVTVPEGVLWSSRANMRERVQLSFPPLVAEFPRISPDGKKVAFMGAEAGGILHIYSVAIRGGELEQLSFGDKSEAYADWSPDGNRLVFSGLPLFMTGTSGLTPIQQLDLKSRRTSFIPGSYGLICPRWSPDGQYLAAKSADSRRLLLYEFRRQRWIDLITDLSINYLSWSHDGKHIYFDTYPGDSVERAIYRVNASNRKIQHIADLTGFRQATGLWSQAWSGLTPEDSPLILRDIGSQELYAIDLQLP